MRTNFASTLIAALLACSAFLPSAFAQNSALESRDESALASKTKAMVLEQCRRDEFSGAVLVAKGGSIITEAVCGEASKRYHVPNKIDTKFNLASVGKMFTAVAIAQLAEAGKLDYQDKISKYVDASWMPASVTERITVAQLLAHSSGLAEFIGQERVRNRSRALYRELDDLKPLLQGMKPEFAPGTRYYYSNTGYVLLGVIVQKVSGQNYFDYVRQHIYQVAGMSDSDSYFLDEPVENLAMGYMSVGGAARNSREATFAGLLRGFSFGCGYSTVHDLLLFSQALQNGKLIKPETLQILWQNHAPEPTPKKGGYGYGFELGFSGAGPVVGHSGGFPGVTSNVNFLPDSGHVVITLSNYMLDFPMGEKIVDLIRGGAK